MSSYSWLHSGSVLVHGIRFHGCCSYLNYNYLLLSIYIIYDVSHLNHCHSSWMFVTCSIIYIVSSRKVQRYSSYVNPIWLLAMDGYWIIQHMHWLHFICNLPPYIFLCNAELALIPITILSLHAMIRSVCVYYSHPICVFI